MNYRHAFHAGNFADVHKHAALLRILRHLQKKPSPYFLLDTHSGRGLYDLRSTEAQRGGEWQAGIGKILTATPRSVLGRDYSETIRNLTSSTANAYPGSPLWMAATLRDKDRAVFVEKHPQEAAALRAALAGRRRIGIEEGDGYAALLAHLPPAENRGLVLIDPPYEAASEFSDLSSALVRALERWPNGIYCVWYPIKPGNTERRFLQTLQNSGIRKILWATLNIRPSDSPLGLNGSGLLIINPPWQLDEQLRELQDELVKILSNESGTQKVAWLVGE